MGLHPQAQAVIDGVASMGLPPLEALDLEDLREVLGSMRNFMLPLEEVGSVEDLAIPGPESEIPLRIYRPAGGEGLRPAILYFHGGGFCSASVDVVDPICRALANRTECVVIAVEYRLAPEHPYPAAVQDCYVAAAWVGTYGPDFGVDSTRLVVAGDSAGATLATVTCMLLRDNADEVPISLQVLLCPVTDLVKTETPSHQENGEGYLLTTALMQRFRELYLTGCEDRVDEPYCSPIRNSNLTRLPPAVIITAQYDPLRDEGEAYGQLLMSNGVEAEVRIEEGMIHNFVWMGAVIDRARETIDEIAVDIRRVLNP